MEESDKCLRKLLKIEPDTDKVPLAHYYCEYAQTIKAENVEEHLSALKKALEYYPLCARASILLGDYYLEQYQFKHALVHFEHILLQDPNYISEVLQKLRLAILHLTI
ncbi:tetratricopeptide repeat protein [Actinobacillus equuli]|nr:tetratricopeptide repeat protein [Actinobacillus equuli]